MRISDWSSDVCSSDLRIWERCICASLYRDGPRSANATGSARTTRANSMSLSIGNGARAGSRSGLRSEEHTSELQSLMRISYAVFCLKKKKTRQILTVCNQTLMKNTQHIPE